jgi:hypothetical protein
VADGKHRAPQGQGSPRPARIIGTDPIFLNNKDLRDAVAHLERGDWQAAHEIVQKDEESPLACWAHGIVHLMEGDVPNARYWYREATRAFPASASVTQEISALRKSLNEK